MILASVLDIMEKLTLFHLSLQKGILRLTFRLLEGHLPKIFVSDGLAHVKDDEATEKEGKGRL